MKKFLTILMLFVAAIPLWAQDFDTGDIYYNIISWTNKTVEVTYRGSYASYYDNEYFGSVVIPESVTYIGTTFSVTSIGKSAFCECTSLTSVTIPESVTSIGEFAFYDCTGLTSITIPNSVTSIGSGAFDETPYYNNMPDGVIYLGKVLYKYKGTMPANTTIEVREGTVSISSSAFRGRTGLTEITIPNSVTSIGDYAFYECTSLTSVTIGNGVTTIAQSAFSNCTGLTSITIGNSVTSIGEWAFYECTGLTEITCLATTPPTIYDYNTILYVSRSIPVNVPAVSVEAYKTASYWSTFTDIQAYEKIETENIYYLDCNDQIEWAVDENSIVEAVFTNVITGYETTVQGSVVQKNDGTDTYTSVVFYLAEGNSFATTGVENALYSHIEFKLTNPEAVTRSSEATLTTGALYLADATKPIYRLATDEWVAYDPTATGIDDALAEDAIIVRGDVVTSLGDIYVYNMSGAMVANGRNEIDLSALQRGIYLIHAGGTVKKVVM